MNVPLIALCFLELFTLANYRLQIHLLIYSFLLEDVVMWNAIFFKCCIGKGLADKRGGTALCRVNPSVQLHLPPNVGDTIILLPEQSK